MSFTLGVETQRRLDRMFTGDEREAARQMLAEWEVQGDRVRIAALKVSGGSLAKLQEAVALGKNDWRDLLHAAGFASDTKRHLRWFPGGR